jgi:hypothetical protein
MFLSRECKALLLGIQQNGVDDSTGIREIPDSIQQKNGRTEPLFLDCHVPFSLVALQQQQHLHMRGSLSTLAAGVTHQADSRAI